MYRRVMGLVSPCLPFSVLSTRGRHHSHQTCSHSHSHSPLESDVMGENLRRCQRVTLVGAGTNVFFSVVKIGFGSSGGSVALVADGAHALFDLLADVVSYAALTLSARPFPRCRFPFGIGRLETAGAVVVAALLLFGGLTLLAQSLRACLRQLGPCAEPHSPDAAHGHAHLPRQTDGHRLWWAMVAVALGSIACKECLFRWTRRVGEAAHSRVVVANAFHHRADAWSGAVALLGVAGHGVGLPALDGLAGLWVAGGICQMGYRVLGASLGEFFDAQSATEVARVRRALMDGGRPHVVNVFLIRHGHAYALHGTLLVAPNTPATRIAAETADITSRAKKGVAVADTFTTLCVCDGEEEASCAAALGLVQRFHALHPLRYAWEERKVWMDATVHEECAQDIRTVADVFGMEVIVQKGEVEKTAEHVGDAKE